MATSKIFGPEHLVREALESGFFQCPKCGPVWFGRADIAQCPDGHAKAVHVAVLCRECDVCVPIQHLAAHLAGEGHKVSTR